MRLILIAIALLSIADFQAQSFDSIDMSSYGDVPESWSQSPQAFVDSSTKRKRAQELANLVLGEEPKEEAPAPAAQTKSNQQSNEVYR